MTNWERALQPKARDDREDKQPIRAEGVFCSCGFTRVFEHGPKTDGAALAKRAALHAAEMHAVHEAHRP